MKAGSALATYPTPDEVRDTILLAIAYTFNRRGLTANVLPGSDHYIKATHYCGRVSVAIANGKISRLAFNPLTAQGDDLLNYAAVFGITPRPAGTAAGPARIRSSATVTIPKDFLATSASGLKYKTVALGTFANGAFVQIIATTGGAATNLGAGAQLTWDSASIGALNPVLIVGGGGLEGGTEADSIEVVRQRLLRKLANPGGGGNAAQIIEWAEEATSSVEVAFAYPAMRGSSSYDVAVMKTGGDRSLPSTVTSQVAAYIAARMPGSESLNMTSVTKQDVDVVLGAALALPSFAGGAGGGWRDAAPWPTADVKVTAYDAGTDVATVNGAIAPSLGAHIGIWDPDAKDANQNIVPAMKEFVVASVGGSSGAWTITAQGGFGYDVTASNTTFPYVSAGAEQLGAYAADFYAQIVGDDERGILGLGPGEKTADPELLQRARRFPTVDVEAPNALTNRLLTEVVDLHDELEDIQYTARFDTGTTTPRTSPSIPSAAADPPRVLTLRHFAIRAL